MAATPNCPLCLGERRDHLLTYTHPHAAENGFPPMDVVRCQNCKLVYVDPMPDFDLQEDMYTDAYDGAEIGYFAKVDKKLKRSAGRVRTLKRNLAKSAAANGRTPRLLDIGANGGFLVEAARRQGFESWGLELDPVSVAYAKKEFPENQFHQGLIEHFAPTDEVGDPILFDALYCSEVIEHVPNPHEFVEAMARLAAPGAVLYLTTPDINHWRVPKDLLQWDAFGPPSHCLYFSPANLTGLIGKYGFSLIRRRMAFKPGIKLIGRFEG